MRAVPGADPGAQIKQFEGIRGKLAGELHAVRLRRGATPGNPALWDVVTSHASQQDGRTGVPRPPTACGRHCSKFVSTSPRAVPSAWNIGAGLTPCSGHAGAVSIRPKSLPKRDQRVGIHTYALRKKTGLPRRRVPMNPGATMGVRWKAYPKANSLRWISK